MNFSTIFIKSFKNLRDFKITFLPKAKKENDSVNLNILVGRNGSGKSTLLDALFEIGKNQKDPGKTSFGYYILNNEISPKIILGNRNPNNDENIPTPKQYWKRVISFHTGDTQRAHRDKFLSEEVFQFSMEDIKWSLASLFLSGDWTKERYQENEDNSLWKELEDIILGNTASETKESLRPEIVWLDVKDFVSHSNSKLLDLIYKKVELEGIDSKLGKMLANLPIPSFHIQKNKNEIRFFWKLNEIKVTKNVNSFNLLLLLLEKVIKIQETQEVFMFINTGFLFKKEYKIGEEKTFSDLFPDESLSDGELGFLRRFALIMQLREENTPENKCLLLLDEPETHFNEYWKSYYLYLIHKALCTTSHDIFIATHSAMLLTDAKPEEIHRMENTQQGAYAFRPSINTYGVNVVDISRSLFMMESDIGNRSKKDIENVINQIIPENLNANEKLNKYISKKKNIEKLISKVGPGEWRWKLRLAEKDVNAEIRKLEAKKTEQEA